MKKLNFINIFLILSLIMVSGCSNLLSDKLESKNENGKPCVIINFGDMKVRTANPTFDYTKLTDITLKGTLEGSTEKVIFENKNYADVTDAKFKAQLESTGNYSFTLTAKINERNYRGMLADQKIESGDNSLSFPLSLISQDAEYTSGKGKVKFTLKCTNDEKIQSVNVKLEQINGTSKNLNCYTYKPGEDFVVNYDSVDAGVYRLSFLFSEYSSAETVDGSYTELVNVSAGCTTEAVRTLDKPAVYVSIVYNLSDGMWIGDAPKSYYSKSITGLPDASVLQKAGCLFDGWYSDSKYTKKITVDDLKKNGDKITLYAKWKTFSPPLRAFVRCTASGTLTVTWINPPSEDFDTVEVKMNNGEPTVFTNTDSDNTRKVYTGLSNGTEYTFELTAKKGTLVNSVVVKGSPYAGGTQLSKTGTNWSLTGYTDQTQGAELSSSISSYTKEIIAIPRGTVAAVNVTSSNYNDSVFTTSRKVKLSSFAIAQYEVTRAFYKSVMGSTYFDSLGTQPTATGTADKNPVGCINFYDAVVFCNKLSIQKGLEPVYSYDFGNGKITNPDDWFKDSHLSSDVPGSSFGKNESNWRNYLSVDLTANGYRLPTEAEWEFCARGGDPDAADWKYKYSGSNIKDDVAWLFELKNETKQVGSYAKNKLNLYDMSGNVAEWAAFFYNKDSAKDDILDSDGYAVDPYCTTSYHEANLKGGGCYYDCSPVYSKGSNSLYNRGIWYGFRLARTLR